jgi:integrase-like protein
VDLSKQLRAALLELRDGRLLTAMMAGKTSIADELVFPSQAGTVIKPDNIAPRYMEPALEKAGLRRFRFHDLRHTFGSLLIQDGASLAYVKDQMGHSSIQITVDTYGHLIPGADIAWVDRLDSKTTPHQSAPGTHQRQGDSESERVEVLEKDWLPPRDSNPDIVSRRTQSPRWTISRKISWSATRRHTSAQAASGTTRQMLEKIILPKIGSIRVRAVTRRDVETLHHGLKATPYRANRVLALLSKMFSLAMQWGWRADNAAKGIPRYPEDRRETPG